MSDSTQGWPSAEPMQQAPSPYPQQPYGYSQPQEAAAYSGQQLGAYGQSSGAQSTSAQSTSAMTGPPPSNAGWAVAAVVFFWPLAFSAFTHSSNVLSRWMVGDVQGAIAASERAKTLGKISLGLFVGLWVLLIVFYVIVFAVVISSVNTTTTY